MIRLIKKVLRYNKTERLERLCVLGTKKELRTISPIEALELGMIQKIRLNNGEIDEVKRSNKL